MVTASHLTVKKLASLSKGPDCYKTDSAPRGCGRLLVRVTNGVVRLYFREPAPSRATVPLGYWDEAASEQGGQALTLAAARREVARLNGLYNGEAKGDLVGYLKKGVAAPAAVDTTFGELLRLYVAHLARSGRTSARDAESLFRTRVFGTALGQALVEKSAREVTVEEINALLRAAVDDGHGRTGAKLRSYLRAAYACALKAPLDPTLPAAFGAFKPAFNPVAQTASLAQFSRARDVHATTAELGLYCHSLRRQRGTVAVALRVQLLLCGQRPLQLLRLRVDEVHLDGKRSYIALHDAKGRRKTPRLHKVPLPQPARRILVRQLAAAQSLGSTWVFPSSVGAGTVTRSETLTTLASELLSGASGAAQMSQRRAQAPLQLRDIRRTCETELATMKISRDVRGLLLSHGLGGVQARHYDFAERFDELRAVVVRWAWRLRQLQREAARTARDAQAKVVALVPRHSPRDCTQTQAVT